MALCEAASEAETYANKSLMNERILNLGVQE